MVCKGSLKLSKETVLNVEGSGPTQKEAQKTVAEQIRKLLGEIGIDETTGESKPAMIVDIIQREGRIKNLQYIHHVFEDGRVCTLRANLAGGEEITVDGTGKSKDEARQEAARKLIELVDPEKLKSPNLITSS